MWEELVWISIYEWYMFMYVWYLFIHLSIRLFLVETRSLFKAKKMALYIYQIF